MWTRTLAYYLTLFVGSTTAFCPPRPSSFSTTSTKLFLEQDIADMIDKEFSRQQHKKEFEAQWMHKNREAMLHSYHRHSMPDVEQDNYQFHVLEAADDHDDLVSMRQYHKDKILAQEHPEIYCADRCIATGHCDVYEDIFDFDPAQVLEFCQDCVLSDKEEPCELPPSFLPQDDDDDSVSKLSP